MRGGKRLNSGGPRPGAGRPRTGEVRIECVVPRHVFDGLVQMETPTHYRTRVAAQILTDYFRVANLRS
jgi:hypothetical protein